MNVIRKPPWTLGRPGFHSPVQDPDWSHGRTGPAPSHGALSRPEPRPSRHRNRPLPSIPGTTKLHRLEENLGAAEINLTPEDLREIERAFGNVSVLGARLPEAVLAMTDK